MPYIDLRDPFGTSYRITTLGEDLLQPWFDFWLPRLYPPDAPAGYGDPVLTAYPTVFGSELDWPAWGPLIGGNAPFTIPRDPALALEALRKRRTEIEDQAIANGWDK